MKKSITAMMIAGLLLAGASGSLMADDNPRVRIETSAGDFVVRLDPERAPLTVANFLQYVEDGHYEGTIFHRIVDGFIIQGGGYDENLRARPTREPVPNESGNGLGNRRGTIAMARTSDPHSADAQFYINLADNAVLDPIPSRWGYAVFGEVIEGMRVADDISHKSVTSRGDFGELPVNPVIIIGIEVLGDSAEP